MAPFSSANAAIVILNRRFLERTWNPFAVCMEWKFNSPMPSCSAKLRIVVNG